jgi:hypothetical protein
MNDEAKLKTPHPEKKKLKLKHPASKCRRQLARLLQRQKNLITGNTIIAPFYQFSILSSKQLEQVFRICVSARRYVAQ